MEEYENDGITVAIDFVQKVNLIRFLGNNMTPRQLSIKAEVIPADEAEEIDFDVAFAKIKFWFENIVSRSVVFCRSNAVAIEMMLRESQPRVVNHMMITPYEPTDEHLAVLFQAKMEALSGGKMAFGYVKVRSTEASGLVYTYLGDWEKDLPQMKEWFSTTPYYFENPWWTRDDVSTIDMIIGECDPNEIPAWAFKLDFIENAIRPKKSDAEKEEPVVIKGAFQPKVIDGGRDDKDE